MFAFDLDGRRISVEKLTLRQLAAAERASSRFGSLPNAGVTAVAKFAAAVAEQAGVSDAHERVRSLPLARFAESISFAADEDIPATFVDGMPEGSTFADQMVVYFSRPPYCWSPDVTKRQRIRDLRLIIHADNAQRG